MKNLEVYVEVIVCDYENRVKKTMKETVAVPKAVLAVHQMFAEEGNPGSLVTAIAQSVFMGARKELDAGRRNQRTAMNEMVARSGGKIGGSRASAPAQPPAAPTMTPAQPVVPPARQDPLAEALGLDLIEHMAVKEGQARAAAPAAPAVPAARRSPAPPVAGFPAGHPGHRG